MSAASLGTAAVLDHAVQNFSAEHLVAAGTEDLDEAVIRLIAAGGTLPRTLGPAQRVLLQLRHDPRRSR